MFHNNYTNEQDSASTPLPQLISKFSTNSNFNQKSCEIGIQTENEEMNLPNFVNLKFQNIFQLNKKTVEKKVIFSKINFKQDEEKKDKIEEILPEINKSDGNPVNINIDSLKSSKISKSNHNKTLSNLSILEKSLPKKKKFKTTMDYYKYLIEKNENNRRLCTNFMVKDHFLIFSKKMKQNHNEESNLNYFSTQKEISRSVPVEITKIKSRSVIPDFKVKNLQLELNHDKTKDACKKIHTFNKKKHIVDDKPIAKEKVKNNLESREKNKRFKLNIVNTEIK